jgi:hypothetical protein
MFYIPCFFYNKYPTATDEVIENLLVERDANWWLARERSAQVAEDEELIALNQSTSPIFLKFFIIFIFYITGPVDEQREMNNQEPVSDQRTDILSPPGNLNIITIVLVFFSKNIILLRFS